MPPFRLRWTVPALLLAASVARSIEVGPSSAARARPSGPAFTIVPAGPSPLCDVPGLNPLPPAPALEAPSAVFVPVAIPVLPVLHPSPASAAQAVAAPSLRAPISALSAAAALPDAASAPAEAFQQAAAEAFDASARRSSAKFVPAGGGLASSSARLSEASKSAPRDGTGRVPGPAEREPAKRDGRRFVWPALVAAVWVSWAALMTYTHHWDLFAENWFMSVTMAFGSFVAGATSEGSGAVSFPVMTLVFHISPAVARDFALMIQSVGMTTAALTIFALGIPVEKRVLPWGILGGIAGMALGASVLAPLFAPPFAKMFFTSLWASFALAHWLASRRKSRDVVERLEGFGPKDAAAVLAFGVIGGIVSSIVGTGLCMVIFTLLTLAYRLSEKIATPTSVVLMASNALFGFLWKAAALGGMSAQAWSYWWVCVPIVVVGAPLGARFIAGRSRGFVTRLLYAAIMLQLGAVLLIVPQTPLLLLAGAATFATGAAVFGLMARHGDAAGGKAS